MTSTAAEASTAKLVDVIYINGRQVGIVKECSYGCHATLNIGSDDVMFAVGLAQGIEDTPEKAVAAAFKNGRADALAYLAALDALEQELFPAPAAPAASAPSDTQAATNGRVPFNSIYGAEVRS